MFRPTPVSVIWYPASTSTTSVSSIGSPMVMPRLSTDAAAETGPSAAAAEPRKTSSSALARSARILVAPRAGIEQREQCRDIRSIGRQIGPVDPHPAEDTQALGAPLTCEPRVTVARVPGGGVDVGDTPALGVLERHEADVWELQLARVVEDERDHVVLVPQRAQRGLEVDVEEVGEHKHDVPLLRHVRQEVGDAGDLGARPPRLGEEQLADDMKQVVPARPWRGGLPGAIRRQPPTDP